MQGGRQSGSRVQRGKQSVPWGAEANAFVHRTVLAYPYPLWAPAFPKWTTITFGPIWLPLGDPRIPDLGSICEEICGIPSAPVGVQKTLLGGKKRDPSREACGLRTELLD